MNCNDDAIEANQDLKFGTCSALLATSEATIPRNTIHKPHTGEHPSTLQTEENPPFQLITPPHCHTCDCGAVFLCEAEKCEPEEEQQCEYCEIWRTNAGNRLADNLDDQAVLREIRRRAS